MHHLEKRIRKMIEVLRELEVRSCVPLKGIKSAPVGSQELRSFENGGTWALTPQTEWMLFHIPVTIPPHFTGRAVLRVTTGFEGEWEGIKPQMLAWVNGEIRQGLDTRHTELILGENPAPGATYQVLLQAYGEAAAPPKQPARLMVELLDTDPQVRQLVYDLEVPWEAACLCPAGDRDRETTLYLLSDALNLLDMRDPQSEQFQKSVRKARILLQKQYYGVRESLPATAVADCVGHTHIDVAWLWDLHQTRHKAVRSFATVLHLMERYPEYKFMSSQPQLYQFVKEDSPQLYEKIKERIAEGRWEVEGGMWVEADCNLTSGESLVRQLLHGKEYFSKEFGKDNRILWLPDVFGYSAALPQILKQSGIDYFMTSKLSWSEFNKYPTDTFVWKGIDGTDILTHFTPTRDYSPDAELGGSNLPNFTTYNALLQPGQIKGGWERFQQKDVDNHYLVTYGYGDGGGGPTEWMLENARRMQAPLPGCPAVRQSFAREFFENLEKRVMDNPRLPSWSGELYLEYHRGTYTAMAKNKRSNRKAELLLREVELWSSYAALDQGYVYPAQELHRIWETVLTLQFHDILPGSSIKKVYDDSDRMYDHCFAELKKLKADAIAALKLDLSGDVLAFNSLAFFRDDCIRFSSPADVTALVDREGNRYPVQREEGQRCIAYVKGLLPMGATPFRFARGGVQPRAVKATKKGFTTQFFEGKFDDSMRITSLVDRRNGRQLVREGKALNRLVCFENLPHDYDAWDINIYYDQRYWEVDEVRDVSVQAGPVCARIQTQYAFHRSIVRQTMVLYRDIPRIDFETEVDWQEPHGLLKAFFPVDVFYNDATFDIQFGNVRRPIHKNTSWDKARFEVCYHKWLDVGEEGYGVAFLNDCKYGGSVDEEAVALTLLKGSTYPNPEADQCRHEFTYSLMPHLGSWQQANVPDMAYQLNIPVTAVNGTDGSGVLGSLVEIDEPGVVAEAVKWKLDGEGLIIRVYECFGGRKSVCMKLGVQPAQVHEVNLMEEIKETLPAADEIRFALKPYEIRTYHVVL